MKDIRITNKKRPGGIQGNERINAEDPEQRIWDFTLQDIADLANISIVSEIVDLPTAELDDTLVLKPDGAGGVEWGISSGSDIPLTPNILIGVDSGRDITSQTENVFIGNQSGLYAPGSNNTFLGWNTGNGNNHTGNNCIFVGNSAGDSSNISGDGRLIIHSYGGAAEQLTGLIYGNMFANSPQSQSLYLNARIFMPYLQTYNPGIAGALYNSGGTVMISTGGGGACVSGDTLIPIDFENEMRMDELITLKSRSILSYNDQTEENEIGQFEEILEVEHEYLVTFITEDGIKTTSTLSHPWRSKNKFISIDFKGTYDNYGIVADLMQIGDLLKTRDGAYKKIVSINTFREKILTYNIKGVTNNYYYANGILTPSTI